MLCGVGAGWMKMAPVDVGGTREPEWLLWARRRANEYLARVCIAVTLLAAGVLTRVVSGSSTTWLTIAAIAGITIGVGSLLRDLQAALDTKGELAPDSFIVNVYAVGAEQLAGARHVIVVRGDAVHLVLPPWQGGANHSLTCTHVEVFPGRIGRRWVRVGGSDSFFIVSARARCAATVTQACAALTRDGDDDSRKPSAP